LRLSRRRFLSGIAAGVGAGLAPALVEARGRAPGRRSAATARVLVIGGGFAGATAARYLARWAPEVDVTLVTAPGPYWTCPFSNTAVVGLRDTDSLEIDYRAFPSRTNLALLRGEVTDFDPVRRRAQLADGRAFEADRVILAPGIEMIEDAIEGYDAAARERFPHAWEAGPATGDLFQRLQAVPDGGLVVVTAPPNPYRCPPGPYERASLMAWWLQQHRPKARLVILDAKDRFTKDELFRAAWSERYPALAWLGQADGGTLRRIDSSAGTLHTDFDDWTPDLACVIPPQRAAGLARRAGLDGGLGWCPVNPTTFESTLYPGVHVIGDAAIANPMPKSAFAANSQGKACAAAIAALVSGVPAPEPVLLNTCYSLVAPDAGIAIAAAYAVVDGALTTVEGASGISPLDATAEIRALEAAHAHGWYRSVVTDAFG
jgi:NADPH-dependent 2,4-dienoyl-CoA reductase/sulfur reductase-like enzyme